jgi:hypothetical protein
MKDAAGDLHADALDALTRLGFSAAQARQALAGSSGAGDIETLLREALAQLRPPVQVSRASEPGPRYGSGARRTVYSSRTSAGTCGPAWSFTLAAAGRSASARSFAAISSLA